MMIDYDKLEKVEAYIKPQALDTIKKRHKTFTSVAGDVPFALYLGHLIEILVEDKIPKS